MSRFFEALERAERERLLHGRPRPQESGQPRDGAPSPGPSTEPLPDSEVRPTTDPQRSFFDRPQNGAIRHPEPDHERWESSSDEVEEHLVSLLAPTSFGAEQYRALRLTVEQLHKTATLSIVAVSSPAIGDGKTTTAINLAGALAQAPDSRVLLVDADLRRPSAVDHLGLEDAGGGGLVDAILRQDLALDHVVRPCLPFNLSILPAGRRSNATYELLKSPRIGELLDEARRRYDYVVLDMPPLIPLPDCRITEKWIDGFLVVVAAHRTPRKLVEDALDVLDPAKIVGLVFNNDDRPLAGFGHFPYDRSRAGWWGRAIGNVDGVFRRRPASGTRASRSSGRWR